MTDPSPVRRALDYLLDAYPMFDIVSIEWQRTQGARTLDGLLHPRAFHSGPWVLVELGQPSENFDQDPAWAIWQFAIFKVTGALHTIKDGAVSDDPIWTP